MAPKKKSLSRAVAAAAPEAPHNPHRAAREEQRVLVRMHRIPTTRRLQTLAQLCWLLTLPTLLGVNAYVAWQTLLHIGSQLLSRIQLNSGCVASAASLFVESRRLCLGGVAVDVATGVEDWALVAWLVFLLYYAFHVAVLDRRSTRHGGRWLWFCRSRFFAAYRAFYPAATHFDCDDPDARLPDGTPRTTWQIDSTDPEEAEAAHQAAASTLFVPGGRYLCACHPHGLFGMGVWATFVALTDQACRLFLGDRTVVSPAFLAKNARRPFTLTVHTMAANFRMPLWREFLLWCGFADVNRGTLLHSLTKLPRRLKPGETDPGHIAALVPGGAAESVDCTRPRLTLRNRKGFLKVAMSAGATLVPVYTFGETELYRPIVATSFVTRLLRRMQKIMGIGMPLVCGRGIFNYVIGMLPRRVELTTVFGQPIDCAAAAAMAKRDAMDVQLDGAKVLSRQRAEAAQAYLAAEGNAAGKKPLTSVDGHEFTEAEVAAVHAAYIVSVEALYAKHRPRFASTNPAELAIA